MNKIVSIKVNQAKLDEIKSFYNDYLIENNGEYVYFMAKVNDVTITGFSSNKEAKKVTFIGENSLQEAKIWDKNAVILEIKEKEKEHFVDFNDQIGSDEVGVGDLFLPMIVVASFIKKSQMKKLLELGIHDSKKMTDDYIKEIGPLLIKEFEFSKLTLSNEKYNEMIAKGENLNSLKAKMHNQALYNLYSKYPDVIGLYVDEFVNEKKYYEYIKNEKHIVKGISFKTKGESRFPCVALASVIARYAFLLEKEKLDKKYSCNFPFGASKKVDEFLVEFLNKHGLEETKKLVKANFKNFESIIY